MDDKPIDLARQKELLELTKSDVGKAIYLTWKNLDSLTPMATIFGGLPPELQPAELQGIMDGMAMLGVAVGNMTATQS
eukprot:9421069-Lingulodinium_polyedra.AAC.1